MTVAFIAIAVVVPLTLAVQLVDLIRSRLHARRPRSRRRLNSQASGRTESRSDTGHGRHRTAATAQGELRDVELQPLLAAALADGASEVEPPVPDPTAVATSATEFDVFASRTVGTSSKHAQLPWRLPQQPAQSGVAADQATVGDLVVRAASVVGVGHRRAHPAQARQDSYRLSTDRTEDHLVIAVSDGVSAAPLAELGATIACRAAVDVLRPALDRDRSLSSLDSRAVFDVAARYMAGAADQRGVSQNDLATVMVIMVIPTCPNGLGGRRAWCAWLGDAAIWLRAGSTWRRQAGDDKAGLDRSTVGAAMPHGYQQAKSIIIDLAPGSVVTVATDGVGDALTRSESAAWFADRWRYPPALASYLMDVDFDARQTTDDRTAVTVWCGMDDT